MWCCSYCITRKPSINSCIWCNSIIWRIITGWIWIWWISWSIIIIWIVIIIWGIIIVSISYWLWSWSWSGSWLRWWIRTVYNWCDVILILVKTGEWWWDYMTKDMSLIQRNIRVQICELILCVTQHSIDRGRNLKNWPLFLDGLFPLYFLPSMTSEWMLVFLYFDDMFVVFWIWYDFEIKCFLFGIGYEQYMLLLLTFCILNKYKQCLKSDNSSSWNMYTIYIYLEIFRLCFKWNEDNNDNVQIWVWLVMQRGFCFKIEIILILVFHILSIMDRKHTRIECDKNSCY